MKGISGPLRTATVLMTIVMIVLMAGVSITLAGGRSSAPPRELGRITCPAGTVASHEGDRDAASTSCERPGGPEPLTETAAKTLQNAAIHGVGPNVAAQYAAAVQQTRHMKMTGHSLSTTAGWQPVGGPMLYATNPVYGLSSLGFGGLSGRISALINDPARAGRLIAAASNGGVWETADSGAHWRSIGDSLPTQVVGALGYSPYNGGTIIAGTGDDSFGFYSYNGQGVFTSNSDGLNWRHASGIPIGTLTFRIAVDPNDSTGKTVYAATSKGLYRSVDGGLNFTNVNLPTTCTDITKAACYFANVVTDVVVRAAGPGTVHGGAVLAVVGWRAGQRASVNDDGSNGPPQSPQNGIYVSPTGQPGTFTFVPSGNSFPTANGFAPQGSVGRVALGIANGPGQNHDIVYALVEDARKLNSCLDVLDIAPVCENKESPALVQSTMLDGAYVTKDFGHTWTKIMDASQLQVPGDNSALTPPLLGYGPGIQSWYNLWIQPDPTATDPLNGAPTRLLFGLEEVWENGNNGSDVTSMPLSPTPWKVVGRYWNACAEVVSGLQCSSTDNPTNPGTTIHPDQHVGLFVTDGQGGVTLYAGSDGGVFAQHVSQGQDFSNDNWNSGPWGTGINTGLHTLQPYQAAVSKDGTIVAGLQDNGEMEISPLDGHEEEIYGGDGFDTGIDPNNSLNILEEYAYGSISVTNDGGKTWSNISPGVNGLTSPQFWTPVQVDPTDGKHFLTGGRDIEESTLGYTFSCGDPACATSNNFKQVYDLGTHSHPGDASASPSSTDPDNSATAVDVRGANAYVGFCGFCDRLYNPYFGRGIATNVGGSSAPHELSSSGWHIAAANGLPNRYITSIRMDPANPRTVYVTLGGYGRRFVPPGALGDNTSQVGTGHVFVSFDAGQTFHNVSGNLPNVPANWSLVRNGRLLVATDVGVFISGTLPTPAASTLSYAVLGRLPNAPVLSLQLQPGNPNRMVAALDGRGVYIYNF